MFPADTSDLRHAYSRVSLALLAYTAVTSFLSNLYAIPYYQGNYDLYFNDWYYYLGSPAIVYGVGLLLLPLILRNCPTPKIARAPRPRFRQVGSGLLCGLGALYAGSYLGQLLLFHTNTSDYAGEAMSGTPIFFALLCTVIIAPILEEIIFRKLLLDRLLFLGDWSALLISALFFALFHTNLYQFFYAFTVGVILGYIRIMTGSLAWNIGLHMFINFFCGVMVDYLPDWPWVWGVMGVLAISSMLYCALYLYTEQPWRNLYPGPLYWFDGKGKCFACLTSFPFWLCVVTHLGLSVYYIIP